MLGLNVGSASSLDTTAAYVNVDLASSLDTTAAYINNHEPFDINHAFQPSTSSFLEQMEMGDLPSFDPPSPANSTPVRRVAPLPQARFSTPSLAPVPATRPPFDLPAPADSTPVRRVAPLPRAQVRVSTPTPARVSTPVPTTPHREPTGQFSLESRAATPALAQALTTAARNGKAFTRSVSAPFSVSTPLRRSSSQLADCQLPSTRAGTPVAPALESADWGNTFTPPHSPAILESVQLATSPILVDAEVHQEPPAVDAPALPFANDDLASEEGPLTPRQPKRAREDEGVVYLPEGARSSPFVAKLSDVPLNMRNKRIRFIPPAHHAPTEREISLNAGRQYRLICGGKRKYQTPAKDTAPPREGAHMGSYSQAEQEYIYICRAHATWDLITYRPWWPGEGELMRCALPAADKATGMTGDNFVDKTFQDTV